MLARAALFAGRTVGGVVTPATHRMIGTASMLACRRNIESEWLRTRCIRAWEENFRGNDRLLLSETGSNSQAQILFSSENSLVSREAERLVTMRATYFGDLMPHTEEVMEASSTLKKRRLKMNKHKHRKRRKRDRRRSK